MNYKLSNLTTTLKNLVMVAAFAFPGTDLVTRQYHIVNYEVGLNSIK